MASVFSGTLSCSYIRKLDDKVFQASWRTYPSSFEEFKPISVSAGSTRHPLWCLYIKSAVLPNMAYKKCSLKQLVLENECSFLLAQ